jgi:hypothetical protein
MGRIGLAFKAFFGTLFNRATAERVALAFRDEMLPKITTKPPAKVEKQFAKPSRSEALTLLEALQREARFIDLCYDSLDQYSDEQIGQAARNVVRDSRSVLDRFFAFTPTATEGSKVELADGFDAARYRLSGQVNRPPYRGTITHGGWQATRCDLPQWTGANESALIVAPAEVEVT